MKKNCFQQDDPIHFAVGALGFALVPLALIGMTHLVSFGWDLTVKTPLRVVISSASFAIGCAWLIWWWFFDPFDEEAQ